MIRNLLLLLVLLAWNAKIDAQDFSIPRESKVAAPTSIDPSFGNAFFGSSAGIALPMGDLGNKDYRNYFSGYANTGFVVNVINFHQKLNRNFGLGASWSRSQFSSEFGILADYYESQIPQIDFIADAQGTLCVVEVNTVPGLTESSLVPKAAQAAGMSFDDLVEAIVSEASLKTRWGADREQA